MCKGLVLAHFSRPLAARSGVRSLVSDRQRAYSAVIFCATGAPATFLRSPGTPVFARANMCVPARSPKLVLLRKQVEAARSDAVMRANLARWNATGSCDNYQPER